MDKLKAIGEALMLQLRKTTNNIYVPPTGVVDGEENLAPSDAVAGGEDDNV